MQPSAIDCSCGKPHADHAVLLAIYLATQLLSKEGSPATYIAIYRQGGLASSYDDLISYSFMDGCLHLDAISHGIQVALGMRLL